MEVLGVESRRRDRWELGGVSGGELKRRGGRMRIDVLGSTHIQQQSWVQVISTGISTKCVLASWVLAEAAEHYQRKMTVTLVQLDPYSIENGDYIFELETILQLMWTELVST